MSYGAPPPPPYGDQPPYGSPPPGGQPPYGGPPPGGQPPYGSPPPYSGQPSYAGMPSGQPPQNYLVWAILSTIFCCVPLGVAGIVFSAQVNGKWAAGDYNGAQESSRKAKQFSMWATVVGGTISILYVILVVLAALNSRH
jgi:hypothetical protein